MLLNLLMTFAQYEMEMTSERIRDKIAECSRQRRFCAGMLPMVCKKDPDTHKLVIIPMHPVPDKAKITILFLFFTIFQWKNNENQKTLF
ncbi:MAG TPA: hypothetical protein DE060_15840 [Lentisphaeria bacterium]|nr:hypothetical protein [Lentisphaeria bacterium]HCG50659.1 hypothetical protein [Lentisphaeria bacterium]